MIITHDLATILAYFILSKEWVEHSGSWWRIQLDEKTYIDYWFWEVRDGVMGMYLQKYVDSKRVDNNFLENYKVEDIRDALIKFWVFWS